MNTLGYILDPSGDICEIGLVAAASPDFAEALIQALLADSRACGRAAQPTEPMIPAPLSCVLAR